MSCAWKRLLSDKAAVELCGVRGTEKEFSFSWKWTHHCTPTWHGDTQTISISLFAFYSTAHLSVPLIMIITILSRLLSVACSVTFSPFLCELWLRLCRFHLFSLPATLAPPFLPLKLGMRCHFVWQLFEPPVKVNRGKVLISRLSVLFFPTLLFKWLSKTMLNLSDHSSFRCSFFKNLSHLCVCVWKPRFYTRDRKV